MRLNHRYRVRLPGQGVVEKVPGTGATRLFAVTVASDGTVWAGGDKGGSLYRVLFLSAFILFCMTFVLNTVAELVRLKLRRKYRYL